MRSHAIHIILVIFSLHRDAAGYMSDLRGPRFQIEPPTLLIFSNSSGGRADCTAEGTPQPRVEWVLGSDGSPVVTVQGARFVLANGSLVFPPFAGEHFRPDVHSSTYLCTASNSAGKVVSLELHVRAVVVQSYEARVYDAQALPGNTAVFRCHVPTFVRDFVTITSWLQDQTFNIYPTTEGDSKHVMLPTGELHIVNVDVEDSGSSYRCRTLHRLTGHTQESATAGKIIIAEPKGLLAPRLMEKSPALVVGRRGEDLVIPCVGQGYPPPKYWWHRKLSDGTGHLEIILPTPGERRSLLGGSLHIRSIQIEDAGLYVCSVNSSSGGDNIEVQLKVLPDLSAHIVPASVRADSGASVDFLCVTSAQRVEWLKDGQRVLRGGEGSVHQLTIQAVQREDQGMYQCLATAEGDAVQATAELRLGASRPQFVYKFIEQTLQPGPDVSLKCIAAGQPTPQILWLLDGFPLPVNERFVIGQYVSVSGDVISHVNISKVAVEDGGTYECTAENRVGKTGHAAPLRVYGMPVIRKMPPISAVAGENLVVTCPAAGFPIHTVTWAKDNRVLPVNHRQTVHPNGTLLVENVQQRADQGKYTCEASNRQKHSDRGSVDVNVMEPPSIFPFSIGSSARLGDRLGLQCLVTKGDGPITIKWLKDDTEVTSLSLPALTVRGMGDFSSNLLIEQLSTVHGGQYTCQASNSAATATHSVVLAVNVPPEITPFSFPELAEGARVQVACTVHRGDLPLNLTWLKNSTPLPNHVHITAFNTYSSILTMSSVRRGDTGNYTCVARNPARTTTYTSLLTISVPPEWVVEPQDISAIAGHFVALHCQAEGFPSPNVTWRRAHGKQASQFDDYETSLPNGTLVIANVMEKNEGYYLCEANNGIGAGLSAVIFLTINALPRFVVALKRETVRRGSAATVACEAVGDAPMQISWRHNGARLSEESSRRYHFKENFQESSAKSELTIHHVTAEDSGKYICIASNPFGKDETVVLLLVQDVPEAPTDVRIVESGSREVKVSWNEPADGNSPILYYSVTTTQEPNYQPNHEEAGEARSWTKLSNLLPATTYYIHVIAVNQLGPGPASAVVTVTTEPEIPSGPPLDVAVVATGPHELEVTWDMPSVEKRNGAILGYYIGLMQLSGGTESRYNYTTVKVDDPTPWVYRGLRSYTQYKVTVQAFNAIGAGPSSDEVVATTLGSVPDAPPQDVQCSSSTAQSVQVSWTPPPALNHNGVILGYQVNYLAAAASDTHTTGVHPEAREKTTSVDTSDLLSVISGLERYHNYTVRVSAFTAQGMGPKSDLITCATAEDVPGVPAHIRAALTSPRSAVVSWSPPSSTNGVLVRYNVYEREVRRGHAGEPSRRTIPPHKTFYESSNLRENGVYEWFVTASTGVGEGPSTDTQTLKPSSKVPAAIVSFPSSQVLAWHDDVIFPCHVVGIPRPEVQWSFNGNAMTLGGRHNLLPNNTLRIEDLGPPDTGNYSCSARNVHSQEKLVHTLVVLVPPPPPSLEILGVTSSNVTLTMKTPPSSNAAVFILRYRPNISPWIEQTIARQSSKYTLTNLDCGTKYQISAAAYNRVGLGTFGPILDIYTAGDKPTPPERLIAVTSSLQTVTIHLERWQDNSCPISHFLIEHRSTSQKWTTDTSDAPPGSSYTIFGLESATFYNIRVSATNSRGTTVTDLKVSTLGGVHRNTVDGSTDTRPIEEASMFGDFTINWPLTGSAIALLFTTTAIAMCFRKRLGFCGGPEDLAAEANAPTRSDYYSAAHIRADGQNPPSTNALAIDTPPDYDDDILPYATFQVQQKRINSVSSHRGFQTFVYQRPELMGADTYAAREADDDDYAHVRHGLRSDNEDYDSLGSDYDDQHTHYQSAYPHSSLRHNRLLNQRESSTSSEMASSPGRLLQHKKPRAKNDSTKKKFFLRGDSRGVKETAFTFPNHQHVAIGGEMSEAECDRGSPFQGDRGSPFRAPPLQYRV